VPTLSPTVNAFYVFVHLYHHFMKEGVGLRQLCDWARLLHVEREKIDRAKLTEILEALGYTKAFCTFGSVLVEWLGLPADDFPFALTDAHKRKAEQVLQVVHSGGNFGKHDRKHASNAWLHSLQTGWRSVSHVVRFFSLSLGENLHLIPRLVKESLSKNLKH